MKNKKDIALIALSTLATGLIVTVTSADLASDSNSSTSTEIKHELKKGKKGVLKGLTDDEKASLEVMTDDEKKAFFDSKKEEREANKEAKKLERETYANIIDKLLAGEELTEEEETLRDEIIEKRNERKDKKEES